MARWENRLLVAALVLAAVVAESQSQCPGVPLCNGCGSVAIGCDMGGFTSFPVFSVAHQQLVETLSLSLNDLSSLSFNDLKNFTSLQILDVSSNNIQSIEPGTFSQSVQLREIDFESNNLQEIPENLFANTPNLVQLNFRSNNIENITSATFVGLPLSAQIDLTDNPLNCDCGLCWLPDFINSSEYTGVLLGSCGSPANLSGMDINNITKSQLLCGKIYFFPPEPPEITELVGPEVIVGETAILECAVFGIPAPNISWEREGTVLMSGERINITEGRSNGNTSYSTLTISNVALSDDGQFTCVANNGVGSSVNSSLILLIFFPPEISTPFDYVEVVIGSDITLTCSASGFHLPNFNWTMLEHSGRPPHFVTNIVNETYVISQVEFLTTTQADTGNYSCIAGNSVGETTDHIFLQVLEPPEITELVGPELEVRVGETAILECTAFGIPAPNISWEREGTVLMSEEHINITEGRSNGNTSYSTLTISNVALSDERQFTCVVNNGVGSSVNSSLILLITSTAASKNYIHLYIATVISVLGVLGAAIIGPLITAWITRECNRPKNAVVPKHQNNEVLNNNGGEESAKEENV